jgi:hypothetical protein
MTVSETLLSIFSYLFSPELQQSLYPMKIVFFIFGFFFFAGTVWFFFNTTWFKKIFLQNFIEMITYKGYWRVGAKNKWDKITSKIKKHRESDCKLALIEAESMLDEVLSQRGYTGSLGEKLNQIKADTVSNIEEVRGAHAIIRDIKHDPNYKISVNQADWILDNYRKMFREIDVF